MRKRRPMFFRHAREGEAFTRTMEQGGNGVRNGYFLRGLRVKGTRDPLILHRLMDFISSLPRVAEDYLMRLRTSAEPLAADPPLRRCCSARARLVGRHLFAPRKGARTDSARRNFHPRRKILGHQETSQF